MSTEHPESLRPTEAQPPLALGSGSRFGYQPELWTVRKDDIYAAKHALGLGIEYARELLANHDRDLGRNHRSNKLAAEAMEQAIRDMQCALLGLRPAPIGDNSSANVQAQPRPRA